MRYFFQTVSLLLAANVFISSPSAGAQMRYTFVNNDRYLFLEDVAEYYNFSYVKQPGAAILTSQWSKLSFQDKKRKSVINGVQVHLSLAPVEWKGSMLLSESDLRYKLDPLLRPFLNKAGTVRKVVLDPGHGGKDKGASGENLVEKELTLDIALRTARLLRGKGWQVILTRRGDETTPLTKRPRHASRRDADVFISIHANYVNTETVRGIESFILPPSGTPATYDNATFNQNCPAHRFNRENVCLAYSVQQELKESTNARDRGVKQANFSVLRNARTPAALVEVGFLSNPAEEKLLTTDAYRQKVARGIARGVWSYNKRITRKR